MSNYRRLLTMIRFKVVHGRTETETYLEHGQCWEGVYYIETVSHNNSMT